MEISKLQIRKNVSLWLVTGHDGDLGLDTGNNSDSWLVVGNNGEQWLIIMNVQEQLCPAEHTDNESREPAFSAHVSSSYDVSWKVLSRTGLQHLLQKSICQ